MHASVQSYIYQNNGISGPHSKTFPFPFKSTEQNDTNSSTTANQIYIKIRQVTAEKKPCRVVIAKWTPNITSEVLKRKWWPQRKKTETELCQLKIAQKVQNGNLLDECRHWNVKQKWLQQWNDAKARHSDLSSTARAANCTSQVRYVYTLVSFGLRRPRQWTMGSWPPAIV